MDDQNQKSSGYSKRPLWQWILLYLVIAAVVYFLIYYFVFAKRGSGSSNPYSNPYSQSSPTTSTSQSAPSSVAAKKITVIGTEYAFNPSTITVSKGQSVEIVFENKGTFPHNFTLSDLGVHTNTIGPGQTTSVTFTPTQTGTFSYICTVPGHADRGMRGTLTVQ